MNKKKEEDKAIDLAQVCEMVDEFMAQGGTYFDTAYVYHEGNSEKIVKKALILIPDMIKALNTQKLYGKNKRAVDLHDKFATEGALASTCVECGQCEGVCPQHLNIIEILKDITDIFEEK